MSFKALKGRSPVTYHMQVDLKKLAYMAEQNIMEYRN